jgi:hypothetical protein
MNAEELKKEPTERTYNLKCKILTKMIHVSDVNAKGDPIEFDRKVVYLIPEKTSQGIAFLNAWLPDVNDTQNYFEVAAYILPPIDSPARLAVERNNKFCNEHHLYVMSKGVEDMLVNFKKEEIIKLDILPESSEDAADNARDTDGDYDVIGSVD